MADQPSPKSAPITNLMTLISGDASDPKHQAIAGLLLAVHDYLSKNEMNIAGFTWPPREITPPVHYYRVKVNRVGIFSEQSTQPPSIRVADLLSGAMIFAEPVNADWVKEARGYVPRVCLEKVEKP